MPAITVVAGSVASAGETSRVFSTPFPHEPGTRARDADGNEYLFIEYNEQVYGGVWVAISNDGAFTGVVATNTSRNSLGIAMTGGTSDQAGWVMVYGYHAAAQMAGADSAATSSYHLVAAGSVSTPAAGVDARNIGSSDSANRVFGAWPVAAASTATTSATSAVGVTQAVWLNYPYVFGVTIDYVS